MDLILKLVNKDSIIEFSKIIKENSKKTVIEGPLLGMESIVKKVNIHTKRAKILTSLMGEPRLLGVGIEFLYQPLEPVK